MIFKILIRMAEKQVTVKIGRCTRSVVEGAGGVEEVGKAQWDVGGMAGRAVGAPVVASVGEIICWKNMSTVSMKRSKALGMGHRTTMNRTTMSMGHRTTMNRTTMSMGHRTTMNRTTMSMGHRTILREVGRATAVVQVVGAGATAVVQVVGAGATAVGPSLCRTF
jgi:hypothetical protein